MSVKGCPSKHEGASLFDEHEHREQRVLNMSFDTVLNMSFDIVLNMSFDTLFVINADRKRAASLTFDGTTLGSHRDVPFRTWKQRLKFDDFFSPFS